MEDQIFTLAKDLTWPAAAGVASVLFIYKVMVPLIPAVSELIQSKRKFEGTPRGQNGVSLEDLNASVKLIGSNHLHSLPEIAETLKRIENHLSGLVDIKIGIEVIKSKLR